jgi:hypothetical protein
VEFVAAAISGSRVLAGSLRSGPLPIHSGAIPGSPVFDRGNHCIAGIVTRGAPDLGQRLGASWQFHETALPIPAMLADLKESEQTAVLLETGGLTIR